MTHRFLGIALCLTLFASLFGTAPIPTAQATNEIIVQPVQPYAADHLIVKLRPEVRVDAKGTHVASLDRSLANLKAVEMQPLEGAQQTYRVEVTKGADILQAVETLNQDAAVEYAEPDYLAQFASAPDDARYSEQWGLAKVQAEGAWAETMGTSTVVIAVIDSGVDLTHEDLAANLWVNPGEIAGNGVDDDNNGFVDDVHGWNFIDGNNDPSDYIGHGSLVAGVAAAKTNNTVGIAGVCGNCRIMAVKITQLSGFANYSDIAAGIYYAADKGAKVINLSVGGYANSTTVQNAINYALNKNIVVVAGAGNDNKSDLFYPAAYEGVIAVAGTDSGDVKVTSSNYGAWVDVSAPGVNILSTTLGDYASDSGTSYATPFVSGAAGLLLSLHPEWTPAMVRSQFLHTTDAIDSLNPSYAGKLGTGRLNLTRAIQAPHPVLSYQSYSGNGTPNLRPDFGSTVDLNVTLYNDWADASEVSGTLSSSDPYVTISTTTADYGTILSGQSVSNATAFTFEIASGAGYNHPMSFSLELSADGGLYSTTVNFTITTRTSEEAVSGTIESDTTWTSDKTYKVTGNVGVPPDVTLTIQPGTVVQFAGNYSLNVGGTLVAQGTAGQPISFGLYTAGDTWNRIYFDDPSLDAQSSAEGAYLSGNVLENVTLTGASGGIACTNATPYLSYVNTNLGGLTCALGDTDLWLTDSEISGAVNVTQGGAAPEHLNGVEVSGSATLPASLVSGSLFSGSLGINGNATIASTTVGSLSISGVGDIQYVTSTNGGISISSGQVIWSNIINGSISVTSASTIATNTVRGGSISVGSGNLITRNDIQDSTGVGINSSGNNTITYNRVVATQKGIVTGSGVVENNLIANTTGNGLEPGTASVRNNTLIGIQGNGVYLSDVPTAFEYNNFEFNSGAYDVYLTVPKTTTINLIGQGNWWGTTSSSAIGARIYDYYDGDYTLAKLIYAPAATMPVQTAPGYVRSVTLDPASPVGIQTVNFTVGFSRPMDTEFPILGFKDIAGDTWHTLTPEERLCGSDIRHIASDVLGNVWITTYGGGSCKRLPDGTMVNIGGPGEYILPDNLGGAWIAGAATRHVNNIGETNYLNIPIPLNPYFMIKDRNNYLWITGNGGVAALKPDGSWITFTSSNSPLTNTTAVLLDAQNNLWFSEAYKGLIKLTPQGEWITYSPSNSLFLCSDDQNGGALLDHHGNMWWGCGSHGITEITAEGEWKNYVSMGQVRRFHEDLEGNVWYGYVGGAAKLNKDGEWIRYSGPSGLTDVHGIGFTLDNEIWFGSYFNGGISVLHIASNYSIETDNHWIDPTHFRSSYEFTTLNAKGDYRITISDINDSDGILIVPNSVATFTVDYAGEISDTTPPATPSVLAWGNGSLTQLSGQASANDPDSTIAGYRYAIGTTPGGTDVVNWTNTSSSSITRSGLILQTGQPYYISFMAHNTGGLWSPAGTSNPVVNGAVMNFVYLPMIKR